MKKVIILHGTASDAESNWIPWLKTQLENRDYQVWAPSLPNSDQPDIKVWLKFIQKNCPFTIDENTILVGHSAGTTTILGLLQELSENVRVAKVILIVAVYKSNGFSKCEKMFSLPFDWNKIKSKAKEFIVVHSEDDPYIDVQQAKDVARFTNANLRILKNQGHFNLTSSPVYKEFPKLLTYITRGPQQHRLYLCSSFPSVAELVMNDIEKKLGKNSGEIKVAFVTTAANLYPLERRTWIERGRAALKARGWNIFEYDLAEKSEAEVRAALADCQVIFVEGGQPIYLLEQMQKCNFEKIVRDRLDNGAVYIGESAGSIVATGNIKFWQEKQLVDVDSKISAEFEKYKTLQLDNYQGMGFLNVCFWPHWNSQDQKKRAQRFAELENVLELLYQQSQAIIALNDNQLVYVEDENFQIW